MLIGPLPLYDPIGVGGVPPSAIAAPTLFASTAALSAADSEADRPGSFAGLGASWPAVSGPRVNCDATTVPLVIGVVFGEP
jgi:hypothetical protein